MQDVEVMFTEKEVRKKIKELAEQITRDYAGEEILVY